MVEEMSMGVDLFVDQKTFSILLVGVGAAETEESCPTSLQLPFTVVLYMFYVLILICCIPQDHRVFCTFIFFSEACVRLRYMEFLRTGALEGKKYHRCYL